MFIFKDLFILLDNQRERERIFYALIHSPNDRNGQIWAGSKPGSKSSFWNLPVGTEVQGLGLSCAISMGSGAGGSRTGTHMGFWSHKWRVNLPYCCASPYLFLKHSDRERGRDTESSSTTALLCQWLQLGLDQAKGRSYELHAHLPRAFQGCVLAGASSIAFPGM